ncbi:MAG: flagellar protein FlgN [Oscillospiraceae bacterium]|nr:flagellar protein FlgN [Oscillospiraceae bacterium]
MNELIARFADIMKDECALHERLLRLSLDKRGAVEEESLQKLDGIVREEQMLLARQQAMEKQRLACVEEFCALTGTPAQEVTMLSFEQAAGDPDRRKELRAAAEKLKDTLNQLKKNNDINSRMIEGRLEYIQYMVGSVSALQESQVYSPKGTEQPRSGQSAKLYDKKV